MKYVFKQLTHQEQYYWIERHRQYKLRTEMNNNNVNPTDFGQEVSQLRDIYYNLQMFALTLPLLSQSDVIVTGYGR